MPALTTFSYTSGVGKFNITNDIERFTNNRSSSERAVKRVGCNAYLSPDVRGLKKAEGGVDPAAFKPTIDRFQGEIDELHVKKVGLISSTPKLQANVVFTYQIMADILVMVVSLSTSKARVPIL